MADVQQSFSSAIEAPCDLCYAAIADFEAYPSWSSPITKIGVLDRYDDGFARTVEFFLDMKLRMVRYVLRYTLQPPHHLSWTFVEGDVDDIVGSYVFEPLDGNRTKATCSQAVTLSFWVPGMIRRALESTALRQSVLEFKVEAERRAAGRRV